LGEGNLHHQKGNEMILIFGSHGFMGSAIVAECERRGVPWVAGERGAANRVDEQFDMYGPELVINAAAYIPSPTVDACKHNQTETIIGNVLWPKLLAETCDKHNAVLAHLSTGCLFNEEKEYTEDDKPTRGWDGYCGFYVGTKRLAEKLVSECAANYILRLRLPFDEFDSPRNYLSKLADFNKVFTHVNSLTHRGDFAKWALDLWEKRSPFGTYHCVNTGQVSAEGVCMLMASRRIFGIMPHFVKSPDTTGARLANDKLVSAIGPVRSVHEAVAEAINGWKPKCS
jgi:dTDP-4-dehydrorhamnose reductase